MPVKTHEPAGLYPNVMSDNYLRLPASVRNLHNIRTYKSFEGQCTITRGQNIFSQIIANMFRFPRAMQQARLELTITKDGDKELWERRFGDAYMKSTQHAGQGKYADCIIERMGPVAVYLKPTISASKLYLKTAAWSVFGLKLPLFLAPHGQTFEYAANDTYHFHVDVMVPVLGRLVKYEGWLREL